jgi:sugar transferase (PEP-CTERM system associated)
MLRVFRHHVSASTLKGMVADAALCFAAVLLAASSVPGSTEIRAGALSGVSAAILVASQFSFVMALMYAFVGLYRPTPIGLGATVRRTIFALAAGGYVTYLLLGAVANRQYAEELMLTATIYLAMGLVVLRGGWFVMRRVSVVPRVLIVGTGPEAIAVAQDLRSLRRIGREVVGFYPTSAEEAAVALGAGMPQVFARGSSIEDLVERNNVREIIVAVREQRGGAVPIDQLLSCRIRGIPILDLAGFYERAKSEVPIDSLKASWLVYGHGFVQGHVRRAAKRTFDIITSSILLIVASPIMLLAMIAIRLDSPGPIIYRQERVGLAGRKFMCLKFRSMCVDAERDGVARWATKNDARISRVGAFMRKTRVDELPQLLSVLRGEMSMVGPRPERPSFVADLRQVIPFYDIRHSVKPGVTGWAQVRYAYGASVDDARRKHQFDLYYVKNNSLFLDLLILIDTVSVVLFREGQ